MARRKRSPEQEGLDLNMTPMIDVVFNLIIFFMVITDMTQTELEYLVLPKADLAIEDTGEDKDRLIVNIVNLEAGGLRNVIEGAPPIFIGGRQVADIWELRRILRHRADPTLYPEKIKAGSGVKLDPVGRFQGKPIWPSSKALLIRCDQAQMFGWVQAVMQICSFMPGRPLKAELRDSPLIYKIEIAVAEKDQKKP